MGVMRTAGTCAVLVVAAAMLGGCMGSIQARDVDIKAGSAMLVNPELLEKGTGNQALYRYVNPKAEVASYTQAIIEPVIINKSGELDAKARENYQTLANNGFVYLTRELQQDFKLVTTPGPGAMRIQFAIIDADSTKPVRNFIGSVDPVGIGLSLVEFGASGKMMGVGEITGEVRITNAQTGELLAAAIDRRVGGRSVKGTFLLWEDANAGMEYWAKRMRYVLCEQRGKGACVNPD